MIFTYKKWDKFCRDLSENGIISICACNVKKDIEKYIVLKHDVETNVKKAFEMAKIEHKYNHRASYYVQAYLLDNPENVKILSEMQAMGHEISYHYDVMDSNKGDIDKAAVEFADNKALFERNGFKLKTVCQHGNPVVERVGYTSNRDFFRNTKIKAVYPDILDIMVDFKSGIPTDYTYFSDAGRKFNLIFDPINNDVINSNEKNIAFGDLNDVLEYVKKESCIISTHPHRWTSSAFIYIIKNIIFKIIKTVARQLAKFSFFKKIMSRYYYLAKKI